MCYTELTPYQCYYRWHYFTPMRKYTHNSLWLIIFELIWLALNNSHHYLRFEFLLFRPSLLSLWMTEYSTIRRMGAFLLVALVTFPDKISETLQKTIYYRDILDGFLEANWLWDTVSVNNFNVMVNKNLTTELKVILLILFPYCWAYSYVFCVWFVYVQSQCIVMLHQNVSITY